MPQADVPRGRPLPSTGPAAPSALTLLMVHLPVRADSRDSDLQSRRTSRAMARSRDGCEYFTRFAPVGRDFRRTHPNSRGHGSRPLPGCSTLGTPLISAFRARMTSALDGDQGTRCPRRAGLSGSDALRWQPCAGETQGSGPRLVRLRRSRGHVDFSGLPLLAVHPCHCNRPNASPSSSATPPTPTARCPTRSTRHGSCRPRSRPGLRGAGGHCCSVCSQPGT